MTNPNQAPPSATGEVPIQPEFTRERAVGALINSALKIVALGALAKANGAVTSTGIVNGINSMLGEGSPERLPKNANNMIDRHTGALRAAGLATEFEYAGKKVTQVTENGKELGISLAGVVGGWQLNNKNLPLQQVFGATVQEGENSPYNSAQVRFNVVEGIINNPHTTLQAIAHSINENPDRVTQAARKLVQDGILLNSKPAARGETIKISGISMGEYRQKGRSETPELLATQAAAQRLIDQNTTTLTKEALLDKVIEFNPTLDRKEVWSQIMKSTVQGRLSYLQLSESHGGLRFNPVHETVVRDLVEGVRGVINSSQEAERANRQGKNILDDKEYVGALVSIGRGRQATDSNKGSQGAESEVGRTQGYSSSGVDAVSIAQVIADLHPALAKLDGVEAGDSVLLRLRESRPLLNEAIDGFAGALALARAVLKPNDQSPGKVVADYEKAQAVIPALEELLADFVLRRETLEGFIHEMNRELPGTLPNRVRNILMRLRY
ncbi:MAG TPA: hypothetical protein VF733_06920 [Candidatus Saccharimonadales bacterium]